jgi:hypothetical protein
MSSAQFSSFGRGRNEGGLRHRCLGEKGGAMEECECEGERMGSGQRGP